MRIHFAGAGQCAEYVAHRLTREGHDLTLLDRDAARCRKLEDSLDARVVRGDAGSIADWRRAGLQDTELFVSCTDSDETNVLACLAANELAPEARIAVRLRTPEYTEWGRLLNNLGVRVDRVIHPEIDILERILRVLSVPGVADIRNFADERIKVFSMNVEPGSPLAGQSIKALSDDGTLDTARICLVFRGTGVLVPGPDDILAAGDHIYVATTSDALKASLDALGIVRHGAPNKVFIVGGGELALELARALEKRHIPAKLFEHDAERCDELAEQLAATTIVNADGTDQRTLIRENIESAEAYVPLTGDDDANLIAALLARRLGVDKVIPLLHRLHYLPLAHRLGINSTVSPRVKAADALLEFIRGVDVLSVRTLGEELAEAIELVVPEHAAYVGKPVAMLALPDGAMLAAIAPAHGDAYLPRSNAIISAGDRLVLFAREDAIRALADKALNGNGHAGKRA